ncbi:MAG: BofC C-terminal domain-containing protein [Clostridiaceae bacterium]|nr:BofC C-terminal domain-containing protein [Clostridiaceae bacterium]
MFRKRKRFPFKIVLGIILFSFAIISFIIGYNTYSPSQREEIPYTHKDNVEIEENQVRKQHLEEDEEDMYTQDHGAEVTYQEEGIRDSTVIKYKTLYTICESSIEEIDTPSNDMIGLTKDGLKEYLRFNSLLFDIENFSTEEVILLQNKTTVCPEHYNYYWLTEEDGHIVIYQFNERGQKILIERTSISMAMLPIVDQQKLKKGILRRTKDDVNRLLEDYSS